MLLTTTLALLSLAVPQGKSRPHLPATEVTGIAKQIATEEGWPIDQKGYTFDPMTPTEDDGFDSIGLYRDAHLVRMYSIDRTTGDIVDFMRGCDIFQFEDLKPFQARIKSATHARSLTMEQLAAKAGCPKLTIVNTRWVQ
jgi:hypothetical protein